MNFLFKTMQPQNVKIRFINLRERKLSDNAKILDATNKQVNYAVVKFALFVNSFSFLLCNENNIIYLQ